MTLSSYRTLAGTGARPVLLSGLICTLTLTVGPFCRAASAAQVVISPAFDIRQEYNDNIFLSTRSRESDFITSVSPKLGLMRNTERLKAKLDSSASWFFYAEDDTLNSLDYNIQGNVGYKLTPRDDFTLGASYTHLSRPDSISESDGLVTSRESDHHNYSIQYGRVLDPVSSVSLSYGFQQQSYDDPAQMDNWTHNAGLGYSRDLGAILPLLRGTVNAAYSVTDYRDSSNDNYSLSVGVGRSINEKFSWNLSGGARYTRSHFLKYDAAAGRFSRDNSGDWGWIGSASLDYRGEQSQASLSLSRNFSSGSGTVGATEKTALTLSLGRDLTRSFSTRVSASYGLYRSSDNEFGSSKADEDIWQLGAEARYRINDYLDLGLRYSYYNDKFGNGGGHAEQNRVLLTLTAHSAFRLVGTSTLKNEVFHGTR